MNPTNPTSPEAAGMNQPPSAGEQLPVQNPEQNPSSVQSPEQLPTQHEQASKAVAQHAMPIPQTPDPTATQPIQNAQASTTDDVSTTTKSRASKIIEDTDLIEKEWVDKAKKIVDTNRDDPYKQSEELTGFRAEYMQKQYNKTIKIDK